MPQIIDLAEIEPKYTVSIFKPKTKEEKIVDKAMRECYIGSLPYREKVLEFREWYMGYDAKWAEAFSNDEDGAAELPGLTSMMAYHYTDVLTASSYNQFTSDVGENIALIPKDEIAQQSQVGNEMLLNNFILENENHNDEMFRGFRGAYRDGLSYLLCNWDYRKTVDRLPNIETPRFDPVTKQFTEASSWVIRDRVVADNPLVNYLDPLLCGQPVGSRMLNKDSNMFTFRQFMYREQLNWLERIGYIGPKGNGKSFVRLKKEDIGADSNNALESPEIRDYFKDMFQTELNTILGFNHDKHKFIVDHLFFGSNDRTKVIHIMTINNIIIRYAEWEGGDVIPVVQMNFALLDTTHWGLSVPEIIQDYWREDNVLTRLSLLAARKEGMTAIFMPQELVNQFDERELQRMVAAGRVIPVTARDRDMALTQQIVPVTLASGSSQALSSIKQEMRMAAQQYANINVIQSGVPNVPSALRSQGVIQAYTQESQGPDKMRTSLIGSSVSKVYSQLRWLVYNLQLKGKTVPANSLGTRFVQVTRADIQQLPNYYVKPKSQVRPLKDSVAQTLIQLSESLRQVSGPVDPSSAYNYGVVMDVLLESLLPGEQYQRIKNSKGTSPVIPQAPIEGGGGGSPTPVRLAA